VVLQKLLIIAIRLLAISISITGFRDISHSFSTLRHLPDGASFIAILLTIGLPILVGVVLWFFAPVLGRLVFSDSEEQVSISLSSEEV
jgi:hypothetical protein